MLSVRDSLYVVVPVTALYGAIFVAGLLGNVSTCVVIARNRHLHTATNYYLFSLAVSDLLLLLAGLPPEMYYIWSRYPYVFGEAFCILQGFAAETSANATVLTITAFTVERYVAICHPFQAHAMSRLSRAVRFVLAIWLLALLLAIPQASQFGVKQMETNDGQPLEGVTFCTIKWDLIDHAFEISTFVFFVVPMSVITVLYILIGIKLRRSRILTDAKRGSITSSAMVERMGAPEFRPIVPQQTYVIRMLVAVVVAFFICWAPFHAQRLLAIYLDQSESNKPSPVVDTLYHVLTYVSGVLYYLSTTVNPVLYHIMSHKFREAFKKTLMDNCGFGRSSSMKHRTYSVLSRPLPKQSHLKHRPLSTMTLPTAPRLLPGRRYHSEPAPYRSDAFFRQRGASESSQATATTSLGRASVSDPTPEPRRDAIKALARRLKAFQRNGTVAVQNSTPVRASHGSIDSAKSTNTISNSSLQDLDEMEFVGAELALYMGELNQHR
ncbi:pyrokinin-1 receptor-like [Anabrus simplex]|uniref:pyrokinin-1 receptor-like n=1 Tax=Anabrus simplex TaxID=316456 RepID=UPI0035A33AA3